MKLTHYIYISTILSMLSACDDIDPVYTVGEADNAIRLEAGIVDGGGIVKTRTGSEDNHAKHGTLKDNTQLRLQVSGIWTGHMNENNQDASSVVKITTASISDGIKIDSDEKYTHNKVSFTPTEQLYWDDYGTADPKNKDTGRSQGLTIYAVANNGVSTAPQIDGTDGKKWEELTWELNENQKNKDWSVSKDLLISNNVSASVDGNYKFDNKADGKLLVFTHAMSKITINLKANNGFPTTAPSGKTLIGNTPNKFENNPEVKLLTRNAEKNEIAYAITKGTVNVTTGVVSPSSDNTDKGIITAKLDHIHDTWAAGATEFQYTVQMTALVVPGTLLGASGEAAKAMTIAKISVDGNDYYVNAEKISTAINGANDYKTEAGKNYVLNITVNKTEVQVTATVADWIDVTAEEATPKIEVDTNYGETTLGKAFNENYSFYLNDKIDYTTKTSDESSDHYYGALVSEKYEENRWRQYSSNAENEGFYIGNTKSPLYWPNHTIKYFFRGVWPRTITTESGNDCFLSTELSGERVWKPSVEKFTDNSSVNHQGIYVKNVAYQKDKFPSDLMIGIPLKKKTVDEKEVIDPDSHDEGDEGISATEGKITLNFTYRMAQVEVHLLSSGMDTSKEPNEAFADNIDLGSASGADQAKVEIVGGFTQGYVLLADGSVNYANNTPTPYEMTPKSSDKSSAKAAPTSYANEFYYRHDAVIPQSLGTGSNPLQFVITTGSNDLTYDTYKINIKDIYVSYINNEAQPSGTKIDKWEAGKHYVYTLKITKTQINIEAKITDWIPVVAGGDFWL